MSDHRTDRRRGGYALLGFALLTLSLLGFAALVIDLGAADTAQSRLEAAAELAALEGPRGWRSPTDPAWCVGSSDPECDGAGQFAAWDAERRTRASARVGALFASGDGGPPRVGPLETTRLGPVGSLGDASLSTRIAAPAAVGAGPPRGPGDPRIESANPLAPNADDLPQGDLVAGTFLGVSTTRVESCVDPGVFEAFGENCRYERADFVPESEVAGDRRSFLARLRLTGEGGEGGVANPDERLTVLFGRLADEGLRQNGVGTRATAISDARAALAAGPPADGLPGVAGVAFDLEWWASLPVDDTPITLTVTPDDGFVLQEGDPVGRVLGLPRATFVGDLVVAGAPLPGADGEAFVPLYRIVGGGERVTAFGRASISSPGGASTFTLRKWPSAVAAAHASAVATIGLRGLGDELVNDLFMDYRDATCDAADPVGRVCAAVLVR